MFFALLIVEVITLLAVVFLLLRRQAASPQDSRLAQVPDQLTRLEGRQQGAD